MAQCTSVCPYPLPDIYLTHSPVSCGAFSLSYTWAMSDDDLETFDVAGAADFLKMSKDTVMRKARTGEVPGTKVGRHWVFIKYDLIKLIRSRYSP